jgi:hypothetical protein
MPRHHFVDNDVTDINCATMVNIVPTPESHISYSLVKESTFKSYLVKTKA